MRTSAAVEDAHSESRIPSLEMGSRQFRVKIGSVMLGMTPPFNPDEGQPNPLLIEWAQGNTINKIDIVGAKQKTECTNDNGLWKLTIKFRTLRKHAAIYDVLKTMKAGPHLISTSFQELCMYLESKTILQVFSTSDEYFEWTMTFTEQNDA